MVLIAMSQLIAVINYCVPMYPSLQVFSEFGGVEKTWMVFEKGCNSGLVIFYHVTSMVCVPLPILVNGVDALTMKRADITRLPQPPRAANTAVPSIQTQSRWSGMLDTYYAIL